MVQLKHTESVPVLIIGFNRPDLMKRSLESICGTSIKKIYIYIDGARPNNNADVKKIYLIKRLIDELPNNLEKQILFSTKNKGCRSSMISAIDWFFTFEESGLIIEDDIIINESFVKFCSTGLRIFKDDVRIGSISGCNLVPNENIKNSDQIWRKSFFVESWGWATWKNRWDGFSKNLENQQVLSVSDSSTKLNWIEKFYWKQLFLSAKSGILDSWAYSWMDYCWSKNLSTIISNVNFIENIGFGLESTHTKTKIKFPNVFNNFNEKQLITDANFDLGADLWMNTSHFKHKLVMGTFWFAKRLTNVVRVFTQKSQEV